MNSSKKKVVLYLLLAVIIATSLVIFAACGKGTDNPPDGPHEEQPEVGGNETAKSYTLTRYTINREKTSYLVVSKKFPDGKFPIGKPIEDDGEYAVVVTLGLNLFLEETDGGTSKQEEYSYTKRLSLRLSPLSSVNRYAVDMFYRNGPASSAIEGFWTAVEAMANEIKTAITSLYPPKVAEEFNRPDSNAVPDVIMYESEITSMQLKLESDGQVYPVQAVTFLDTSRPYVTVQYRDLHVSAGRGENIPSILFNAVFTRDSFSENDDTLNDEGLYYNGKNRYYATPIKDEYSGITYQPVFSFDTADFVGIAEWDKSYVWESYKYEINNVTDNLKCYKALDGSRIYNKDISLQIKIDGVVCDTLDYPYEELAELQNERELDLFYADRLNGNNLYTAVNRIGLMVPVSPASLELVFPAEIEATSATLAEVKPIVKARYDESFDDECDYDVFIAIENNEISCTLEDIGGANQTVCYTINAGQTPYSGSATVTVKERVAYRILNGELKTEYFTDDELECENGAFVTEYYYPNYTSFKTSSPASRTAEISLDIINGFDVSEPSSGVMTFDKGGVLAPENCTKVAYTVIQDYIVSISVNTPSFVDGIVIGEEINLVGSTLKALYYSGKSRDIPVTADMVGEYGEVPGAQEITVSYAGRETTVEVVVHKVRTVSVEEGLASVYMVGQEVSGEVVLKVTFVGEEDYDYVALPEGKLAEFDTASAGNKSFAFTYGGVNGSWSYRVVEKAYLVYTVDGERVTISSISLEAPSSGIDCIEIVDVDNVVIPDKIDGRTVTAVAANAFKGNSFIRRLELPEGIAEIGDSAFEGMTSLKEINIPDSATTLGTAIVDNCMRLEKLTVSGTICLDAYFRAYSAGSGFNAVARYPRISDNLTVFISDETTVLVDYFLAALTLPAGGKISRVVFGEKLVGLGSQLLVGLKNVRSFESRGAVITVQDNIIFSDSGATLYYYPSDVNAEDYTVPLSVNKIEIMEGNNYIKTLVVGENVTELGVGFMSDCENLESVEFSGALSTIPYNAFNGCERLSRIVFPKNLTTIGVSAFAYTAIEDLILPQTVTSVGNGAFYMSNVKRMYIPTSATQSMLASLHSSQMYLPKLNTLAYDGSVKLDDLCFTCSGITTVYVTGEQSEKAELFNSGNTYSGTYSNITYVGVCSPLTSATFPKPNRWYAGNGNVRYEANGEEIDKWWL